MFGARLLNIVEILRSWFVCKFCRQLHNTSTRAEMTVVHPKMLVYHSSVPNVTIAPRPPIAGEKLFQIRLTLQL